jgi:hypothetical protein
LKISPPFPDTAATMVGLVPRTRLQWLLVFWESCLVPHGQCPLPYFTHQRMGHTFLFLCMHALSLSQFSGQVWWGSCTRWLRQHSTSRAGMETGCQQVGRKGTVTNSEFSPVFFMAAQGQTPGTGHQLGAPSPVLWPGFNHWCQHFGHVLVFTPLGRLWKSGVSLGLGCGSVVQHLPSVHETQAPSPATPPTSKKFLFTISVFPLS